MPSATGPSSWLDAVNQSLSDQSLKPLIDSAEEARQKLLNAVPAMPSFASGIPSLDALKGPVPDETQPQQPDQSQQQQPSLGARLASAIPALSTFVRQPSQDTQASSAAGATPPSAASPSASAPAGTSQPAGAQPSAMPTGQAPSGGAFKDNNERLAYVRQSALAHGHDPDVAARVAMSEGAGPAGSVGDNGTSFGALQAHVGGGQGDDFRQQTGLDPADPANERALIDWQIGNLGQTGWSPFHGAAAAGIGDRQGIGTGTPTPSGAATAQPAAMPSAPQPTAQVTPQEVQHAATKYDLNNITPNQFTEGQALGLDPESQAALCGIAGAVALQRAAGQDADFGKTFQMAKSLQEWNADLGMVHGSQGELTLLKQMGVDAHMGAVDPNAIAAEIQAGRPVEINAHGGGGHFYIASGVRQGPEGLEFNFGNSAAILRRSGGQTWWRLDQLAGLGVGTPSEAIYMGSGAT